MNKNKFIYHIHVKLPDGSICTVSHHDDCVEFSEISAVLTDIWLKYCCDTVKGAKHGD